MRLLRGQPFIKAPVIRLALFTLFVIIVYITQLIPIQRDGYPLSSEHQTRLMGTIRAANGGEPFHFYLGDGIDPGPINPDYLYPWANTAEDYGFHLITAWTSILGREIWGADFFVDSSTPYKGIFVLWCFTAMLCLWWRIPIRLSLGLFLAFFALILLGPLRMTVEPEPWGTAYMAFLCALAMTATPFYKKSLDSFLFLAGLAFLIAFTQFLRQSGSIFVYAFVTSCWAGSIALIILSRRASTQEAWRADIQPFIQQVMLSTGFIFATFIAAPYILLYVYSIEWGTPYSETELTDHGIGLPLYLGTGYIDNPYNINWLDLTGEVHARLYKPDVIPQHANPEFQDTLVTAWAEVAQQDPLIVVGSVVAKTRYTDHMLRWGKTPYITPFLPVTVEPFTVLLYWIMPPTLIASGLIALRRRDVILSFMISIYGLLLIGGSIIPLMIFPGYTAGMQGIIYVISMVLPFMIWSDAFGEKAKLPPQVFKTILRTLGWLIGSAILMGGIGVAVWIGLAEWQQARQQADLIDADSLTELRDQEFRFGYIFNQLNTDEQEKIIDQIIESDGKFIALPTQTLHTTDYFEIAVAVLTEHQLHIFIQQVDSYQPPKQSVNQAQIHTILQACLQCDALLQNYSYNQNEVVYDFLGDKSWRNRYRMVSFAVDISGFQSNTHFLVGIQHIVDWGGGATGFSYQVQDAATYRLEWKN